MIKYIDNFSIVGRLEIIFFFDIYRFLFVIILIVIYVKLYIDLF